MARKEEIRVAVIGGSGLYQMDELKGKREIKVKTPFGDPSDALITGKISGVPCVFLPRHGRRHTILPSEIPQKANIYALKSLGVKVILSVSAVGSLKQGLAPSHFVFPDQFVDETKLRDATFFGDGAVAHFPMAEPFCGSISEFMHKEAVKMGIKSHLGGIYACMEGPGFSTRAESMYHRKMGYSIIGMTVATEAKLAREAGLCYSPVSLVTDYDCWKEGEEVDQNKVINTLRTNVKNIRRLLARVVPAAGRMVCKSGCGGFARGALLTDRKHVPLKTYNRLKLLIG